MGRPSRVSTPTTKIFAERLSDLVQMQKEKGLSHDEISKQIGVSSGVLSEWMSDNKTASIENLANWQNTFLSHLIICLVYLDQINRSFTILLKQPIFLEQLCQYCQCKADLGETT